MEHSIDTTPLVEGGRPRNATWRSSRTICGVAVAAFVIVALAISGTIDVLKNGKIGSQNLSGEDAINAACLATLYPATCSETLFDIHNAHSAGPRELTRISILSAAQGVKNTLASVVASKGSLSHEGALDVCEQTLVSSIEQLEAAHGNLILLSESNNMQVSEDVQTKLSAAMEFHTTCIDTLVETRTLEVETIAVKDHTEQLLSIALAFMNAMSTYGDNLQIWKATFGGRVSSMPRRLLSTSVTPSSVNEDESFPGWLGVKEKEQLLVAPNSNVVVAKDGSGNFRTIQAAINASPQTGSVTATRYVIYIKAGVYDEQVTIPKSATNFMFVGDGAWKTVITGDRSVALTPGMTTYMSATLIIEGSGFIGKSFTAQNTAGAAGHQAVAIRVSADKAAFYQCSFDSWQDTLYTHTLRHYYRETTILGTIDFIFGNSNAAFQSCTIIAKKSPTRGPQNTYTAQGRTDPGMNTGLSFQGCTFDGTSDLKANTAQYKTYLGRPWKAYSTCVNLKCNLLGHIDPAGWLPWNASDFGLYTSYFAEYQDFGAGANSANRVKWSHQITNSNTAINFQAVAFIQANSWVPATGIPLTTTL